MYLTKYFNDAARPFIESGNFRFGTLQGYRRVEGIPKADLNEYRFSDQREGLVEVALYSKNGYYDRVDLPGGSTIYGGHIDQDTGTPIAFEIGINDYVFCATCGPYSSNHHRRMKEGADSQDGIKYEGDDKLTNYAVLDLKKFLTAVHREFLKSGNWDNNGALENRILHQRIEYRATTSTNLSGSYGLGNEITFEQYKRAVFCKPQRFSIEEEYRVVIHPFLHGFLPRDAAPISLVSPELKASIVDIGP